MRARSAARGSSSARLWVGTITETRRGVVTRHSVRSGWRRPGCLTRGVAGPIVCLLPARNAAAHLRDWLATVEVLADAVVALDDGSTDDTGEILRGAPIVTEVLTNPRRETVAGWDNGANRARLLRAAGSLEPAWIMQVDADERIPADDADELRTFLETSADPTFAYSFRVYRMVGDLDHFDADHDQWVTRCFAFDPALRLPVGLQHIVPVPTVFEASRRIRTTFRIQHLSGLTPADRRAQYAKYRVVDPDGHVPAELRAPPP